jgi:L-fuculose-phosphate aldolase
LVTVSSRVILKEVPWIDCALPGSRELCDFVHGGIQAHPDVKALLMKEHGILALGSDLKTAYYLADLVEDTAKIAFIEANIKMP